MENPKKARTDASILPFNPKTTDYNAFVIEINVDMANYILNYHNFDNRNMYNPQINNIYKSIQQDGWLHDGQPITFNVEGNLTEGQHRLAAISRIGNQDKTYTVIIVTGVEKDTFSKTATNKARKPIDEITRVYRRAHRDEVSVLGDILKRKNKKRLSLQNAIRNYEEWIRYIQKAIKYSGDYEYVLQKWAMQRKTMVAFMTLCRREDYNEECNTLLELLDQELEYLNSTDEQIVANNLTSTQLPRELIEYYNKYAVDLSNESRMNFLYALLCSAIDLIKIRPDGNVSFANVETTSFDVFSNYNLFKNCTFYKLNVN